MGNETRSWIMYNQYLLVDLPLFLLEQNLNFKRKIWVTLLRQKVYLL